MYKKNKYKKKAHTATSICLCFGFADILPPDLSPLCQTLHLAAHIRKNKYWISRILQAKIFTDLNKSSLQWEEKGEDSSRG